MENLKVLTDNLSLNPYTRRSLSMKVNNELYTHNKSIIRAINEVYLNQKSIFNSIMYLYKKLNITIGDIVEDKELKIAYSALQFANIMDGLVKLNQKVETMGETSMHNEIVEIYDILKTDDEDVDHIFDTMHWNSIIDALIKIDKKIADYIVQDTESAADEYTQIRDEISSLISIIGSTNETNKNKLISKFGDIINAVLVIDNYVGTSDDNLQQLNDNGFVSITHAVLEFSGRLSGALTNIETLNESQIVNNNNFESINNAITNLTRDLQGLAASMGQATGSDLSELGYDSITDGLAKLAAADRKIIEVLGNIDSEEEYITEYKELGYENVLDAIVTLNGLISSLVSTDPGAIEDLEAAGFDSILVAVNSMLKLLGIPELDIGAIRENGYESVVDAIVKITATLGELQTQITDNNNAQTEALTEHIEDLEAHPDCISGYFRHKVNHKYEPGEIVFIPELPNNLCLICINGGTTGEERPDFERL